MQERFVPLEKRSKKARRSHYASRRSDWNGVIPTTKVIPNKKKQELDKKMRNARYDVE